MKGALPRPDSRIRPRNREKRCFELAGRYQIDDPSWTLVHGSIVTDIGIPIAHGWLKRDGWIYDAVANQSFLLNEYKKRFGAMEVATFTPVETARAVRECGHWGPWAEYSRDIVGGLRYAARKP